MTTRCDDSSLGGKAYTWLQSMTQKVGNLLCPPLLRPQRLGLRQDFLISSPLDGSAPRVARATRGKGAEAGAGGGGGGGAGGGAGATATAAAPAGQEEEWSGFCACCKRPLIITPMPALGDEASTPSAPSQGRPKRQCREKRYAYVVAIWGSNLDYVLGAMVLGHSIRNTGSKHDLVVLHTDEVCEPALELLRTCGWILKKVEHVQAAESLFMEGCLQMRFANVFTKLHVFGLTEYSKVLMMDSDILVRRNIDDLFDLEAPAAMARGALAGYKHGEPLDGRSFFSDANAGSWAWGQGTGINAGVMLFEPSEQTLSQCLREVGDEKHPEHLRGNGPEQDYLSRYFADCWRHIDVAYNFQLHQMYYALNPLLTSADRRNYLSDGDAIKAFHYSSDPKPWARYTSAAYAGLEDKQWFTDFKMTFTGHRVWILKEPQDLESETRRSNGKLAVGSDGKLHKVIWNYSRSDQDSSSTPSSSTPSPPAPEPIFETTDYGVQLGEAADADPELCAQVEAITDRAIQEWEEAYRSLERSLGERDLASRVIGCAKEGAERKTGTSSWSGWGSTYQQKEKWAPVNGWWVERPMSQRVSVCAGRLPQPFTTVLLDDGVIHHSQAPDQLLLLELPSPVASPSGPRAPLTLDLRGGASVKGTLQVCEEWARSLPNKTYVGMAAVLSEHSPDVASLLGLLFKTLASNSLGSPGELPAFADASPAASVASAANEVAAADGGKDPMEVDAGKSPASAQTNLSNGTVAAAAPQDEASALLVFVACGRKGEEWSQTHAAPSIALATTRIMSV